MKNLPALSAQKVLKVLYACGYKKARQKGSHVILIHPARNSRVVLPMHTGKTIKKPLLSSIIKDDMKITIDEFLKLL